MLSMALLSVSGLTACAEEEDDKDANKDGPCLTNEAQFAQRVWPEVLSAKCIACHNPQGVAADTGFVLQDAYQTGFLDANYATLAEIASVEKAGTPLVLLKPTMGTDHEGGLVIEEGSTEYELLKDMVSRYQKPVKCEVVDERSYLDDVSMLDPSQVLRKATLTLAGRLPTDEEFALVEEGGDAGLDAVLERVMAEERFYDWLVERYNDQFLTDKYLGGDEATSLLDEEDYPARFWYDEMDEAQFDPYYVDHAQRYTNNSVARAPLELIAHIVRNDRPFTEIITADYMMVNPFSATVYGLDPDTLGFEDQTDPNEYVEARIPDVPHSGILTSPMWLQRFPTTDTNVNRHRSRMVWQFFLATDVLKLAERPIDPTAIVGHNPTMNDPNCNVCHANIDPIAGAFQNWDDEGRYRPPEEGWKSDMLPPGFGKEVMPWDDRYASLRWLGTRIAEDPRFVTATIHTLYKALTGRASIAAPTNPNDPDYALKLEVFLEQDKIFTAIGEKFVESNYNVKVIIRELLKTPYYRAKNVEYSPDSEGVVALDNMGVAQFLTPEALNRKIQAVTGYPWRRDSNTQYLLSDRWYLIFYGGIDSDSVTQRITDPNGLMANVGQRMANEMSCLVTARDFRLTQEDRNLFPHVEMTFTPEDIATGFTVDASVTAIKQNIQHLHKHILGEDLEINDPEIEATYQLFYDVWKTGVVALEAEETSTNLNNNCRAERDFWTGESFPEEERITSDDLYTVRAWMAVVSYMMSDYRFLYE